MSELLLKGPFIRLSEKSISDEDFEADAKLTIDGDWRDAEHKEQYLQAIIKRLNQPPAAPAVSDDFVRIVAEHLYLRVQPSDLMNIRAALEAALARGNGG